MKLFCSNEMFAAQPFLPSLYFIPSNGKPCKQSHPSQQDIWSYNTRSINVELLQLRRPWTNSKGSNRNLSDESCLLGLDCRQSIVRDLRLMVQFEASCAVSRLTIANTDLMKFRVGIAPVVPGTATNCTYV